ncbi:hypothetical protein GH714_022562 [Hevea brasiliensis]|uniref:POPLD domain-containing protein n=1 Tax=Hevea brasiliensis TaxID=3981 RepID=A0A6A6NIV3_HEVBR|nr:hypothetical protein GH714_022562 [Hevea brasiliensis]
MMQRKGSRALLKWYKHGALVHDASYYTAVQLEGPEDSLTSILRMVLEPPSSAQSEEITNAILSGFIYGTAMLHHVGAPVSQLIAPVTYMWRPYHLWNGENGGSDRNSYGCNELQSSELCSSHRQLWVWIHASAFSEGYDALKFACQKHMNESGILINCFSLEGQLAKLEVIGSKAFQLLQKILHPVYCDSKNSWQPKECVVEEADHSSELKNSSILENEENISSCSIFYLTGNPEKNKELILLPCSKPERDSSLSDKRDLWDASCRVSLPVEENVLCLEKHHLRMDFVCLDNAKSGMLTTSTKVQGSRSSPIVLLKLNNGMDSFMGWSIIIPLCWVKVFWMAFISKGAHAIGLREKRWIACEVGLPFFPSDFPDCNAYLSSMTSESAALNQKAEQVCPAVRPLKVPVPPPWNSVRVAVTKGCIAVQVASSSCAKDIIGCNSSSNSRCDNSDITSLRVDEFFSMHIKKRFEEGAIVCAPCLSDVSLLTSRSENNETGLQIPVSLVRSYFKEQSSGKWELQIPEDSAARESHRWPIGFVTTGFVRGGGCLCIQKFEIIVYGKDQASSSVATEQEEEGNESNKSCYYSSMRLDCSLDYLFLVFFIQTLVPQVEHAFVDPKKSDLPGYAGHFKGMHFRHVIKHYMIQAGNVDSLGAVEDWTLKGKRYSQLDTSLKHEAFMLGTSKAKDDDKGFEALSFSLQLHPSQI